MCYRINTIFVNRRVIVNTAELKRKARENEGMTVSEIKAYEKLVKPKSDLNIHKEPLFVQSG